MSVLRSRLRTRVLVTTKDKATFAGVLFQEDKRAVVLREAVAVGAGEDRSDLPLDGEIIILVADVAYIQRP